VKYWHFLEREFKKPKLEKGTCMKTYEVTIISKEYVNRFYFPSSGSKAAERAGKKIAKEEGIKIIKISVSER